MLANARQPCCCTWALPGCLRIAAITADVPCAALMAAWLAAFRAARADSAAQALACTAGAPATSTAHQSSAPRPPPPSALLAAEKRSFLSPARRAPPNPFPAISRERRWLHLLLRTFVRPHGSDQRGGSSGCHDRILSALRTLGVAAARRLTIAAVLAEVQQIAEALAAAVHQRRVADVHQQQRHGLGDVLSKRVATQGERFCQLSGAPLVS
jgi:hypothetical protein